MRPFVVAFSFVALLAACVGDDPTPSGGSSGTSGGSSGTSGGSSGTSGGSSGTSGSSSGTSGSSGTPSDYTGDITKAKVVFVTSATHDYQLGGVSGADAICQKAAGDAKLSGTFLAWIATGTADAPIVRFTAKSSDGYKRVDGTLIAYNWNRLVSGTLHAPLNLDETGKAIPATDDHVWTDVHQDGTPEGSAGNTNCAEWGVQSSGATGGVVGHANAQDSNWTSATSGAEACASLNHLYCFQQ